MAGSQIDWAPGAPALSAFNSENAQVFTFDQSLLTEIPAQVQHVIRVADGAAKDDRVVALATLRILSRDNRLSSRVFNPALVQKLCQFGQLTTGSPALQLDTASVVLEAEKVLGNLLLHEAPIRTQCVINGTLNTIVGRLRTLEEVYHEILLCDMRILFLLTTLSRRECLVMLCHEMDLLQVLCSLLLSIDAVSWPTYSQFITCTMRVLYTLTLHRREHECSLEDQKKLVDVLRTLMLKKRQDKELVSEITSVLSNLSQRALSSLMVPSAAGQSNTFLQFNMDAVDVLLEQLEYRLEPPCVPELLCVTMATLSIASKGNRILRRYIKSKILPPLTDVMSRPEEGSTLRNKIVRLMTSPSAPLMKSSAELLFVLCKEKPRRLIKYTGYGNAAGFLADRKEDSSASEPENNYSSESEDSDTEEYIKYKAHINSVLGCYEAPRPSPVEDLTDEQKMYQVQNLLQLMDRLSQNDILKPCILDANGKPQPVEHIMQLIHNRDSSDPSAETSSSTAD